jgi:hypothetical protein
MPQDKWFYGQNDVNGALCDNPMRRAGANADCTLSFRLSYED